MLREPKPGIIGAVSGDFVIELPDDERLGAVLGELHEMSPQVYLSRVEQPDLRPVSRSRVRSGAPASPAVS